MVLVHAHIFKPHKAIFKDVKRDKAECHVIDCEKPGVCGLFARGECSLVHAIGWHECPYGTYHKNTGYTTRAKNYYNWLNKKEKEYKDIGYLEGHTDMMTEIGDYIFLPYTHITMNEYIPFLAHGGFMRTGNCFLPKEAFTVDNIINICNFRPRALMGGEITNYQKKEVPKFLIHLSECMPQLFKELCTKYERAKEVFQNRSYIGRKALLSTVVPNIGTFGGEETWMWDGEYLTSTNGKKNTLWFKIKGTEVRIKPVSNAVVEITDNKQVNSKTKLLS